MKTVWYYIGAFRKSKECKDMDEAIKFVSFLHHHYGLSTHIEIK